MKLPHRVVVQVGMILQVHRHQVVVQAGTIVRARVVLGIAVLVRLVQAGLAVQTVLAQVAGLVQILVRAVQTGNK